MRLTLTIAVLAGAALAQRPTNTTICDYYTTALLGNASAANEATVLTLLVNTVVIGNYTKPNISGIQFPDIMVPGILKAGKVNGTDVNLLPYFDGGLASSNRGGDSGVAVNFLDDGGAVPLMLNKPANGTDSNQYQLLTHLYQFFGSLLQCSSQGMNAFPAYAGAKSMYQVHRFMDLDQFEVTYFIEQVGLAAASFGVAKDDIQIVGNALGMLFNYKCAPETTVIKAQGPDLQSICVNDSCPQAPNATCSKYDMIVEPGVANSTLAMGEGNSSSTATASAIPSMTGSMSPTGSASGTASGAGSSASSAAAATHVAGVAAAGGLALFAFLL